MLGKLMKYDMKYMARVLPWMYLGGICFSILCCMLIAFVPEKMEIISFLSTTLMPMFCVMMSEAIVIITVVFLIMRTYRSLYSDEGYLTFTLPVKNSTILNAKILTGAVWMAASLIVAYLVTYLPNLVSSLVYAKNGSYIDIPYEYGEVTATNPVTALLNLLMLGVTIITVIFLVPSLYTFCCTVTHKAKRARAFASIGMFVGIMYAVFIIAAIILVVISATFLSYVFTEESAVIQTMGVDFITFIMIGIVELIIAPVTIFSWLMSCHIVNKKLNLL